MKTCAILVAAYRADPFIGEAIASFQGQLPRPGWSYDFRIGVDACPATAAALKRIGVSFWQAAENRGAYIIRNSLAALRPADAYCIFDADDIMLPWYLLDTLAIVEEGKIGGPSRLDWNQGKTSEMKKFSAGVMNIPAAAWEVSGGFRPERMSSDTDLLLRLGLLGFSWQATKRPCFIYRRHSSNITKGRQTGLGSPRRRRAKDKMKALRNAGFLKITPTIISLELVEGEAIGVG